MNGADALAGALVRQGVEWISTLCGHGLNEVYAACGRAGIRLIDTRNEQTAAYMAECWGRLSRQVGVCAASSGVAHVNALTGVTNAHFDGAPMLLITGCGPTSSAGRGHFQDFDQVAAADSLCKYARVLDVPERIPEIVHEAFRAARSGRPGPVHLTFPMDVQDAPVEVAASVGPDEISGHSLLADAESIRKAVDLFAAAERPLLIAGSGAYYAGAGEALTQFTAAYAVPFVVPIWDRGAVQGRHSEYIGVIGSASGGPRLLEDADLVVLLGAAADYRVGHLLPPAVAVGARVLRVDVDPTRLHGVGPAELTIQADPASVLTQLLEAGLERKMKGFEAWLSELQSRRDAFRSEVTAPPLDREEGLHALDIVEAMAEIVDDEAVVVVDGGNIGQWFHQTMARDRYPDTFLTCGASGVVGYGIGGAMAARAGYPDRQVVLLSGDGAATFNIADLECAARQSLPFVMIVADDESWGITVTGHLKSYGEAMSCRLGPVDFAGLANSLGALGTRVSSKEEMVAALRRGLSERLPVLIHALISGGLPGDGT